VKRFLHKIFLILIVSFVSLCAVEILYRIYLFGWNSVSYPMMKSIHPLDDTLIQKSSVPGLPYELKPNVNTYYKKARFVTNAEGLRDKEYARVKPQDVFRIAVIGDSFSFPDGVEIKDAYHSILEERLNAKARLKKYEAINFSVGGYGPASYLTVLRLKALKYSPDLILLGFNPGNDYDYAKKTRARPYVPKRAPNSFFYSYSIEKIRDVARRRLAWTGNVYERLDQEIEGKALDPRNLNSLESFFYDISALTTPKKIPVVIVNLNIWQTPPAYVRAVREMAERQGFYFEDLSAPFERQASRKYQIFRADYHPNAAANRIFAAQLYEFLIKKSLLVPLDAGPG